MVTKSIGITGSRKGLSEAQKKAFLLALSDHSKVEIHHGDCLGVDDGIHKVLFEEKLENPKEIRIVIHPPSDPKQRAFCNEKYSGRDILIHSLKSEEYLLRNQAIVDQCEELWAFPDGPEKLRSGTWATIRYARKTKKLVKIFEKDGAI